MRTFPAIALLLIATGVRATETPQKPALRKLPVVIVGPAIQQMSRALEGFTLLRSTDGSHLQLKPDFNHGPVATFALHY